MPLWLIIGIGSFIGGILRYWISGWVQSGALTFPLGTLSVNFIGSLILSLIMYLSEHAGLLVRRFEFVGLLDYWDRLLRCLHSVTSLFGYLNRTKIYCLG